MAARLAPAGGGVPTEAPASRRLLRSDRSGAGAASAGREGSRGARVRSSEKLPRLARRGRAALHRRPGGLPGGFQLGAAGGEAEDREGAMLAGETAEERGAMREGQPGPAERGEGLCAREPAGLWTPGVAAGGERAEWQPRGAATGR